jgi:hypothetical protein
MLLFRVGEHGAMNKKCVIIVGLRRSGTTILWEMFRQDKTSTCFDEPLHPQLWCGKRENAKGTWAELGALWNDGVEANFSGLDPISPLDELEGQSSLAQQEYLAYLLDRRDQVVIDLVRVWNRLPDLLSAARPAVIIQIVRSPAAWATAHLLPSGSGRWRKPIQEVYRHCSFFSRYGFFDKWHYESIINMALELRHPVWSHGRMSKADLSDAPAFLRLLAFWWASNRRMRQSLCDYTKGPVRLVTLEDFVRRPKAVIEETYRLAGWQSPSLNFDRVRPVRDGWHSKSRLWREAYELAGIPRKFLPGNSFAPGEVDEALMSDANLPTGWQ